MKHLRPSFQVCENCFNKLNVKFINGVFGTWTDTCNHCGNEKGQVINIFEDAANPAEVLQNHNNIMKRKKRKESLNLLIKKIDNV
jgi:hypothetical protein